MKDCWYKERISEAKYKWKKGIFHGWSVGSNYNGHPNPVAIIEQNETNEMCVIDVIQIRFKEPKNDSSG